MRNKTPRILVLLVEGVFAATVAGCKQQDSGPQPASASTPTVAVVHPLRKCLDRVVEQPGAVHAYEETQLFARVPGYVGKVHADIGQKVLGPKYDSSGKVVAPGQILAEIAVPELEEEFNQKKALTRQAEAEVEQSQKALAAAQANIATVEASVVEAKAMFDRWESESKRITKLVSSGTLDAQARDEADNQLKAAGALIQSTQAAVLKAKADRDKASADVRAAEARVDVAKADALRSEAMLGYAKIRAPFDGIVTAKKVNTGDLVHQNGNKTEWLFTVARLDLVRIVVAVPEADAGLVQDGAKVKLSIKAAEGTTLIQSTISRISWALEPGARTLRAEIELPNKEGRLRPGMYVYAQIVNVCPECWTLPTAAVVKQGDAMVCFVIQGDKAVRAPVQIGRGDGQFVEVSKYQKSVAPVTWVEFNGTEAIASRATGLADGQFVKLETAAK